MKGERLTTLLRKNVFPVLVSSVERVGQRVIMNMIFKNEDKNGRWMTLGSEERNVMMFVSYDPWHFTMDREDDYWHGIPIHSNTEYWWILLIDVWAKDKPTCHRYRTCCVLMTSQHAKVSVEFWLTDHEDPRHSWGAMPMQGVSLGQTWTTTQQLVINFIVAWVFMVGESKCQCEVSMSRYEVQGLTYWT